jgi:flagellar biogenesis protein FliO
VRAAAGRHDPSAPQPDRRAPSLQVQSARQQEITMSIATILFILWFVVVLWWLMSIFSAQNRRNRK